MGMIKKSGRETSNEQGLVKKEGRSPLLFLPDPAHRTPATENLEQTNVESTKEPYKPVT